MELKDTKGYRSQYINALNQNVKLNKIIGGDVQPIETETGTNLLIQNRTENVRFQLFGGLAETKTDGNLYNTLCVADGSFIISGKIQTLKSANNVRYFKKGLRPRSRGWACKSMTENWNICNVIIVRFNGEFYIAFHFDNEPLKELISGAVKDEEIEQILTIGEFNASTYAITQFISADIFYGGEAVAPVEKSNSFEVQMWDYQYSTRKVGIRNGAWDFVDWLTKEECEEIGEDSNGAPKLVFKRSHLKIDSSNALEGHPEFKDITYFFQNLTTARDDHVWEVFISRDKRSSINGLGLQILETTESELRQRFAPPHIIKVAEIHKRDLPNIKRFVGDISEDVSEGGLNLYKITNAGSSGEVYDKVTVTGEVYDANCNYALISRWRRITKQAAQVLCNEEIKNATSTFVPLESHASDHTNGVL